TRPVTARLPWDHIDVGLEDGFLLGEYRKAVKGRASPPCGKVAGMLIHHTNLAEAEPDRLVALRTLGAEQRPERPAALGAATLDGPGLVDVSERGGGSPAERDERG